MCYAMDVFDIHKPYSLVHSITLLEMGLVKACVLYGWMYDLDACYGCVLWLHAMEVETVLDPQVVG